MCRIIVTILIYFILVSCTFINPLKTVIINSSEKLEKIVEKSKKVVFFVRIKEKRIGGFVSFGTAFVFNENGLLATVYHVISNKYPIEVDVLIKEGDKTIFKKARWHISKKYKDLAILYIDYKFKDIAKFRTGDLVSGEFLYSIGHPDAYNILRDEKHYPPTISYGNFFRYIEYSQLTFIKDTIVQLSTVSIRGGSSGSPMFDKNGNIVGINSSVISGKNDFALTISIPIKYLINFFSPKSF